MANNHGVLISTHMTSWDVDAMMRVGLCASDVDNGVFVTMGDIANTNENIEGYQFTVTPATSSSTNVWICDTRDTGANLEMALYNDPRYFYNKAGRPISLRYPVAGVDCIEVTAECFAGTTMPSATNKYIPLTTGGKLGTPTNSAPQSGAYLVYIGKKTMEIGAELVPSYVLQMARN